MVNCFTRSRGPTADEYYWQFLKKFSVVAVILVLALASLPVLGPVFTGISNLIPASRPCSGPQRLYP
jgi:hypothetical protein